MPGFLDPQTPVTIANYARGAWDGVTRNHRVMRDLKAKGQISYNETGEEVQGPVEAGRHRPIVSAPGMDLSEYFQPRVRHARYTLPWGEIANATVLDRGMLRRNSGKEALVKLSDTEIPAMIRDTLTQTDGLIHQFLNQDGNGYSGSGLPMYGLPSCLLGPGTASLEGFDPDTGASTGVAAAATDREVCSGGSDTYAGLSLAPGGLTGVDNVEYDAWMPTLVNAASSGFPGTGVSGKILESLQYLVTRMNRFSSSDPSKMPDWGVLSRDYHVYLGEALAAKQTVYVQNDQRQVSTPNLGYNPHTLPHAGVEWIWDDNMPASSGYLLNLNAVELKIQPLYADQENGAPFKVDSPEDAGIIETNVNFDWIRRQYVVSATIPGQFCLFPRYLGRIGSYAA